MFDVEYDGFDARELNDAQLIAGLKRCVAQDCELTARLLMHFGEVDARGLFRDEGFDSMFAYSVFGLHMSESVAMTRIGASRVCREFPQALEMLARGELHLTALRLVGPVLTHDNLELLEQARFKSKRQILELLAERFPQPDVPSVIRRLPQRQVVALQPSSSASDLVLWATPVIAASNRTLESLNASDAASANADHAPMSESSPGGGAAAPMARTVELLPESFAAPPIAAPGLILECELPSAGDVMRLAGSSIAAPAGMIEVPPARDAASSASSPSSAPPCMTGSHRACDAADPLCEVIPPGAAVGGSESGLGTRTTASCPAATARVPPSAASSETPLSAGRYKIQFTADQRLHDKLKRAQDLMRHQVPTGDLAQVFERALDLLIREREMQVFAKTAKPRSVPVDSAPAAESRHIPHAVRREVASRDGEQCTFVTRDGQRCQARGQLEFHHEVPFARAGQATAANIRLLCRAHNAWMADRDFGRQFMVERRSDQNGNADDSALAQPRATSRPFDSSELARASADSEQQLLLEPSCSQQPPDDAASASDA